MWWVLSWNFHQTESSNCWCHYCPWPTQWTITTLRQNTKLAKSIIHNLNQRYLKIRFQMLWHKRLNEVINTDTCFATESLLRGIFVHRISFAWLLSCYMLQGWKLSLNSQTYIYISPGNMVSHPHSDVIMANWKWVNMSEK
jgi:hypothetical protein